MRLSSTIFAATTLIALASPAFALSAVTIQPAGFSSGPGNDYDVASTLKIGTRVDIVWCGTHDNWCLVDLHNKRGWVPMASLDFKAAKVLSLDSGDGSDGKGGGAAPASGAGPRTVKSLVGLFPHPAPVNKLP